MLESFMPLYSPGARRLYHVEANDAQAELTAEVRRTLDALAAAAPARIAGGRSTKQEAEAVIFLWLALCEDLEAQDRWIAEGRAWPLDDRLRALRAKNGVASWTAKVEALRREILRRRAAYPDDVGKGRLAADEAKRRLERLEAIHDLYWRHGYAFDGTMDELRQMSGAVLDTYLHPSEEIAA